MLIYGSRLIGYPVLSIHMGAPIGWVDGIVIDPNDLRIVAFRLRDIRADEEVGEYLEARDVREFSDIGMIIDSTDALVNPDDVIKLSDVLKLNFMLPDMKVVTKKKAKLGRVIDYTLDTKDWMVQQIVVKRPLLKSLNDSELLISRKKIDEITDYKIIIKDELEKIKKAAEHEEFVPNFVNPFRNQNQQPQFSQAHNQTPDEPDIE